MKNAPVDLEYRYQAFGLGIVSAIELPELAGGSLEPDVRIGLGPVEGPELADLPPWGASSVRNGEARLAWRGVGRFRIRRGAEIMAEPAPEASPERLRLFVLGAAMGVLLHQRGLLVLHASAVSIRGRAVAFIGDKRSGKSTLAAILHSRGHPVLSDDVLVIDSSGGRPGIPPGIPQLKLWPDALNALGRSPSSLPRVHPNFDKRAYLVGTPESAHVPLGAVCVLNSSGAPGLHAVEPHRALSEVIKHWYCTRYGYETLAGIGIRSSFVQSTDLARGVPFYRFTRPRAVSELPAAVAAIEDRIARDLDDGARGAGDVRERAI